MEWYYINEDTIKVHVKRIGEYQDNIPKVKKLFEQQPDARCIIFEQGIEVGTRSPYFYHREELV